MSHAVNLTENRDGRQGAAGGALEPSQKSLDVLIAAALHYKVTTDYLLGRARS